MGHIFLLPSLEYKLRLAAWDGASSFSMSINLPNGDFPKVWYRTEGLVLEEDGSPALDSVHRLLKSFISKDLAEELKLLRDNLS